MIWINELNGLKGQDKYMSQSLAQIYVHIVFSTKERCPFINTAIDSCSHGIKH